MLYQTNLLMALAASASAHMIMDYPKPFGRASLTSSPLAPADFPCKQRNGVYAIDTMNQWNAGETQSVSFNGTAVHGGGSCQFSISTDLEPTEQSQWKVIQSVIGNCPSNVTGNLPEGSKDPLLTQAASTFPVTMPSNIPEGRYTFAWTWINKVGNREFYMNCAPIQVGGSSNTASTASAAEALSTLPDMFVANLPADDCSTGEGEDFEYPDAGQNVVKGSIGTTFGSTLSKPGCNQYKGSGPIGSPSPGTPSTPPQGTPSQPASSPTQPQESEQPAASPSPDYSAPQQPEAPSNPGGAIIPGAPPAPIQGSGPQPSAPAAQPAPPAESAPPAAEPAPSAPETPSDNNTAPVSGDCTPCTDDGAIVCIGDNQFGLCNRGCAVPQALSAGMSCSGGAVVASTKRHVHFPRAHLHRRFSAARL